MAFPFALTQHPIRVTTTGFQPMYLALDIGAFDALDIELGVLELFGSVTIQLWSGLQNQTDSGWVLLHDFGSKTGVFNAYYHAKIARTTGVLRYLRWKVTSVTGGGSGTVFFIKGVGRSLDGRA